MPSRLKGISTFVLSFLCISLAAQEVKYSGYVADETNHSPVIGAVVIVATSSDTLYTTTDGEGGFAFKNGLRGSFTVEISHISYQEIREIRDLSSSTIDFFSLKPKKEALKGSKVTSRAPVFTFNGDTLVYHVAATQEVSKDEMLIDIITKLPGVTGDNKIMILGKAVEKVYIDDRLIFGDNPHNALEYLAGAEVVNIKVYDEQPDSKRNKTDRKKRVIDVKTKNRIDIVHAAHFIASYGRNIKAVGDDSDNRYTLGGEYNIFSERFQLQTDASIDNTGRQNKPKEFYDTKNLNSAYERNISADFDVTKKFEKSLVNSISFNYRYDNDNTRNLSSSSTTYSPSATFTERIYNSTSESRYISNCHKAGFNFTSYRLLQGNLNFEISDMTRNDNVSNRTVTDAIDKTIIQENTRESGEYRFNGNLYNSYSIKRIQIQPEFRIDITRGNGSYIQADSTDNTKRRYLSDPVGKAEKISFSISVKKNLKWSMLKDKNANNNIELRYNVGYDNERRRELRFLNAVDEANLENLTSNDYTYSYTRHRFSLMSDLDFLSISLPVIISCQNQDRLLPEQEKIRRKYLSFEPSIMLTYLDFVKGNFSLCINRTCRLPSLEQTNPYIDTRNPMFVRQGNVKLKQEADYSLNFTGFKIFGNGHSLNVSGSARLTTDAIVEDRRFYASDGLAGEYPVGAGSTFSTYQNVSGAWSANASVSYKTFLTPIKTSLETIISYDFSRSPSLIEGDKIFAGTHRPAIVIDLKSAFSKKYRISLNSRSLYTSSTSTEYGKAEFFNESIELSSENKFADWVFFNAMWGYNVQIPISAGKRISSNIVNAVLGFNLTPKRNLSLSFSCYDIFDATNSFQTVAMQNYVRETFSPFLGRFWSVNLIYKFNSTQR